MQDTQIQKLQKQAKATALLATSEATKSRVAKELVQSITEQVRLLYSLTTLMLSR